MPLKMPYIDNLGSVQKPTILAFSQLDKREKVSENAITDGENLSSDLFPILTCRGSRELIATIANPQALFSANGKLCYVSGTNFFYDGVSKGAVTAGPKSMVDFNGKVIIFPDKKYYDYTTGTFGSFGGGAYPAAGSCPAIDYVASHTNRLYGVKDNNLYATTLGEYDDWTTFAGDNLDAYAVDIVDPGKFIGISAFQQHITAWKPGFMYELYGAYPAQYQLQPLCKIGTVDNKSVIEVNKRQYFLDKPGVYEYSGGLPRFISENLNDEFVSGSAATDERKYYLSARKKDGTHVLMVYDTWREMWMPEDNLHVIEFATIDKVVYALDIDGHIYKFNSGDEDISWGFTTDNFTDNTMGNKEVSGLTVQADLESGSSMSIYLKTDNKDYSMIKTITKANFNNHSVPCKVTRGQRYQFKIVVHGKAKIHGFRREFVVGGDV